MLYTIATPNDINQLIQMRLAFIYDDLKEFDIEKRTQIEKQLPKYFNKHLGNDLIAFIAKDNKKVISMALLLILEKPANIQFLTGTIGQVVSVYTHTEYRKKGIAKELMQMLLSYSKKEKLDFVELKATELGYNLYKNLGFIDDATSCTSMKYNF